MYDIRITIDKDNDKILFKDYSDYSSATGIGYIASSWAGDIHVTFTFSIGVNGVNTAYNPGGVSGVNPEWTIGAADWTNTTPNFGTIGNRYYEMALPTNHNGTWYIYITLEPQTAGVAKQKQHIIEVDVPSMPTCALSLQGNNSASLMTSTDSTDYSISGHTIDTQTRLHELFAPVGATDSSGNAIPSPADSGPAASITYTGITTGMWQSTVNTDMLWTAGTTDTSLTTYPTAFNYGQYFVKKKITCGAEFRVISDLGLCNVYCCLKALNMRYEEAKCKNKDLAEDYKAKIEDVTRLLTLLKQAEDCGLQGDASQYLLDIKSISECGTECDCYDSEDVPTGIPITSAVSTTNYKVETSSSRLSVESSGSGSSADPVVYSVDLGPEVSGDISYIAGGIQSMGSILSTVQNSLNSTNAAISSTASAPDVHYFTATNNFGTKTVTYLQTFISGTRFNTLNDNNLSMPLSTNALWPSYNNRTMVTFLYPAQDWDGVAYMVSGEIQNNTDGLILDIHTVSYLVTGSFNYTIKDSSGLVLTNSYLASNYPELVIDFTLTSNITQ